MGKKQKKISRYRPFDVCENFISKRNALWLLERSLLIPASSKAMKYVPCRALLRREYMHGHDQHKPKLTPHTTAPPCVWTTSHPFHCLRRCSENYLLWDALRWNNLVMSEIIPAQEFKSTLLWWLLSLWCVFVLASQYWVWLRLTNGTKLWTVCS